MKEELKKAYNALADEYFRMRKKGGTSEFYNEMVEMPTTLRLLGNVKGKNILDLGCGPGRYAMKLTAKGARVIGIDNSKNSLIIAEKEAPKAIFIFGDIENLPFKDKEFDIVLSALVMGHFRDWSKIFREVRRVLKRGGLFVFSVHNPFSEVLVNRKWFLKKFRIVQRYFDERMLYDTWGEGNKKFNVAHHHKTYGTIIKIILNNGFELIDYEDCKPIPKSKDKYPGRYERTMNAPNFCSWKVRKK